MTTDKRDILAAVAVVIFIQVAVFTALAFGLARVNDVATRANRVACGLHSGYVTQLESNRKFVKANPHGGVLLGVKFTRKDLDAQAVSLRQRIKDTADAKC